MKAIRNVMNRARNRWFFSTMRFRVFWNRVFPKPKSPIDRQVEALMTILDKDLNIGISARATPEAIERLMESDNPFAGYVISCLVHDDALSKKLYDEWLVRSINRTDKESGARE